MQKGQHRDLTQIYKDVNNKGRSSHMTSINNEKQRIADIIQDREDKRLYKIALKEAKQKWKVGVKIFRQKETLERDIQEAIIDNAEEQVFSLAQTDILDVDDSNFEGPMITVPGGLCSELIMTIDAINKQYK